MFKHGCHAFKTHMKYVRRMQDFVVDEIPSSYL
jgi:hypothetical protein